MCTEAPAFGYAHQYQLPAGCIRLVQCFPEGVYWKIEGDKVLSDATGLRCTYIFQPQNLDTLDPLLAQAVALKLATKLAYPQTENKSLVESIQYEYDRVLLTKARGIDSLEDNVESSNAEPSWLESRSNQNL